MISLKAHFDGKVMVPDEHLDLPANQKLRIEIEPIDLVVPAELQSTKPSRVLGRQQGQIVYFAADWDEPLPDHFWKHNDDAQDQDLK